MHLCCTDREFSNSTMRVKPYPPSALLASSHSRTTDGESIHCIAACSRSLLHVIIKVINLIMLAGPRRDYRHWRDSILSSFTDYCAVFNNICSWVWGFPDKYYWNFPENFGCKNSRNFETCNSTLQCGLVHMHKCENCTHCTMGELGLQSKSYSLLFLVKCEIVCYVLGDTIMGGTEAGTQTGSQKGRCWKSPDTYSWTRWRRIDIGNKPS